MTERPYIALSNNELECKYVSYRNWARASWDQGDYTQGNGFSETADQMLAEIETRKDAA